MEIITYNIWDLPLWFVRNRKKRLREIGRFVAERGTDIVCLQESWSLEYRAVLSEYMRAQGYHDAIHQARIKRNNGGLLTFSKFPITSVRFIPFGRWGLSVSEFIGNKGVLETIIETPAGVLRVLNIHLHHESSKLFKTARMRMRQLRKIFAVLKKESSLPTILAGDFNQHDMHIDSAFMKIFDDHGFTFAGPRNELSPTYRKENPFVNNWINRIAHSQTYDYIFVKDLEKLGMSVAAYDHLYIEPVLSDHDPVLLTLS